MKKPVTPQPKKIELAPMPLYPWERSIIYRIRQRKNKGGRSIIQVEIDSGRVSVAEVKIEKAI